MKVIMKKSAFIGSQTFAAGDEPDIAVERAIVLVNAGIAEFADDLYMKAHGHLADVAGAPPHEALEKTARLLAPAPVATA